MGISVLYDSDPGLDLGFSVERLADSLVFDFATGTFSASPASFVADLPEVTAGPYAGRGRYEARLGGSPPTPGSSLSLDPAVFPDGDYVVTVHDSAAGDVELEVFPLAIGGGSGGTGTVSQADIEAALDAQGYTSGRAALLDRLSNLDTSRPGAPASRPVPALGPQSLGTDRDYLLGPLLGPSGSPVAFTAADPLSARLWRSDGLRVATLAVPTATWEDPAAGTIRLAVPAAAISALAPGTYAIEVIAAVGARPLGVLWATIVLRDSPLSNLDSPVPALTAAGVERMLVRRCRDLLRAVGMDAGTTTGANLDVQPAVATALRRLGYPTTLPDRAADLDLAAVPAVQWDQYLHLARVELLEHVLDRLTAKYDLEVGINKMALSQVAAGVTKTLLRLRAEYEERYVVGAGATVVEAIESDYPTPVAEIDAWPWTW
jgi:hypothetical protein